MEIKPALIPTDHDLVSARISTPMAPKIGKGRWVIPTRLIKIKNRVIKVQVQKLGRNLEKHFGNINPDNPIPNNPHPY